MLVGIVHREGSFSNRWIEYCKLYSINFRLLDINEPNFITNACQCGYILFHFHHHQNDLDQVFSLLTLLESKKIKIYPNINTRYFYEDKIIQEYIFRAYNINSVSSKIVKTRNDFDVAQKKFGFPLVLKKANGAGSSNVFLVRSRIFYFLIKNIYSILGVPSENIFYRLNEGFSKLRNSKKLSNLKTSLYHILRGAIKIISLDRMRYIFNFKKTAIIIQKFIPNVDSDIRIIVIDKKAFGLKRFARKNDFRASGSGIINYSIDQIPLICIQKSFEINKFIKSQSLVLDFILDGNEYKLLELSCFFSHKSYYKCNGYWDIKLKFHPYSFFPEDLIIKSMIN